MGVTEFLIRRIGHPIWLAYKGEADILKFHRQFTPLWTAERNQLELRKLNGLRALLSHANTTSSYYRELFQARGFDPSKLNSPAEVSRLPFITKEILNERMAEVLSKAFQRAELIQSSTGGSSGLSLTFYRDRRVQSIRRSQDYLFNARLGIHPGARRAWVWGSPIDAFSMKSWRAKVRNLLTERAIYFYAFDATPDNMVQFLEELNRHRPEVIIAYPNMLSALARLALDTDTKMQPVRHVIVTAEPLYDWQRELFRRAFGAETCEHYGAREIGTVASECVQHQGMHVFEPTYHLEIVDDRGQPVPDGQLGELIVTDLYNYAMPLIRYRTGDMVALESSPCPCGSTWRRITQVGGRIIDMLVRPDGSKVEGLIVVNSLHLSQMRARVQVIQTAPTQFTVRFLAGQTIPDSVRDSFQTRLSGLIGAPVTVVYEPVEQLRYEQSGKYRYVICECDRSVKQVSR